MESRWEVRRLAPSTKLALANALKKLLQKKFLARAITASTLAESARDLPLPERELDFLADFYMYAIAGMMMGWLSDDMREEPEEIVGRLDRLLEGEFRRAAEKFSAGEPVS